MADSAAASAALPPPPATGAAPGQAGYQNGSNSHMPPPLNIPQNNNNVPAAVTSALGEDDLTSPMSSGPRRAAPEPNKRALYVGGLDPRVTEDVLKQIFETTGHVQNVKIIPDKNVSIPTFACAKTTSRLHLVTHSM
jgi:nucleolysin TIA-1/TIAR